MSCQGTGYTILPGNHCTEKMQKNILKLNKGTHFACGKQSNLVSLTHPIILISAIRISHRTATKI